MKIFCVIDTNVIVSALPKRTSTPGKVVQHILAGIAIPVFSKEILSEYKEVLSRKKFNFSPKVIEDIIKMIIKNGIELSGIQTFKQKRNRPTQKMCFFMKLQWILAKQKTLFL